MHRYSEEFWNEAIKHYLIKTNKMFVTSLELYENIRPGNQASPNFPQLLEYKYTTRYVENSDSASSLNFKILFDL